MATAVMRRRRRPLCCVVTACTTALALNLQGGGPNPAHGIARGPLLRHVAGAGAAAVAASLGLPDAAHALAPESSGRSVRPLLYRIEAGNPPLMQPYTGRGVDGVLREIARCDAVVIGVGRGDADDAAFAAGLVKDVATAARRNGHKNVAVALGVAPYPSAEQTVLAELSSAKTTDREEEEEEDASSSLARAVEAWPAVGGDAAWLEPVLAAARDHADAVIAAGVEGDALRKIQQSGKLDALSPEERRAYVDDPAAFVEFQKTKGFDVYAQRVVERKYDRAYAADPDAPSKDAYFASTVLQHEAAATRVATYLRDNAEKKPFVIAVLTEDAVKFGLGASARLARLRCAPGSTPLFPARSSASSDAGATPLVRSVLVNPSADSTFSVSSRLRLSITLRPELAPRPLADFVWFSASPPPNLITHMMNPIDGNFNIDLGLSTGAGKSAFNIVGS